MEKFRDFINLSGVLAVAAVIGVYSLIPQPGYPSSAGGFSLSFLYHGVAYMALAASIAAFLHGRNRGVKEAVFLSAVFGLGIETLQSMIPGRFFTFNDIFFNSLGASIILLEPRLKLIKSIVELEVSVLELVSQSFENYID